MARRWSDPKLFEVLEDDKSSFLELAKKGGIAAEHQFAQSDLSGIDLSGESLDGFDFSRSSLKGANFSDCSVLLADFSHADLSLDELRTAKNWQLAILPNESLSLLSDEDMFNQKALRSIRYCLSLRPMKGKNFDELIGVPSYLYGAGMPLHDLVYNLAVILDNHGGKLPEPLYGLASYALTECDLSKEGGGLKDFEEVGFNKPDSGDQYYWVAEQVKWIFDHRFKIEYNLGISKPHVAYEALSPIFWAEKSIYRYFDVLYLVCNGKWGLARKKLDFALQIQNRVDLLVVRSQLLTLSFLLDMLAGKRSGKSIVGQKDWVKRVTSPGEARTRILANMFWDVYNVSVFVGDRRTSELAKQLLEFDEFTDIFPDRKWLNNEIERHFGAMKYFFDI